MFYKIETGLVNISFPQELAWGYSRTRAGGTSSSIGLQTLFFEKTVPMWNTLPVAAVQADKTAAFKAATSAVV